VNKVFVALGFVGLLAAALAQTYVGSWAITEAVDPFTDERSTNIQIGDNGQVPAEGDAQLVLLCTNGTLESILVQFNSTVDTAVAKDFDYRLDSNAVLQGRAWVNGRGMALGPELDGASFEAFTNTLLAGGSRLAVRVRDARDEFRTAIFTIDRIQEAMERAQCAPAEPSADDDPFGDADDAGGADDTDDTDDTEDDTDDAGGAGG
jgi:hypothetical protein